MELQQEIAFDKAESMIGRELEVMVEGKVADENAYVARTYKDAPGVDGYLFLNTEGDTDERRFREGPRDRSRQNMI